MTGDAGFALPEVLIAGLLSLCLALPAFALLRRTYDVADLMQSRFRLNGQARQAFALLADGGAADTPGPLNPRGFPDVEGLRSRAAAPAGSTLRAASRLVLPDGALVLSGDAIAGLAVSCTAPGQPIPDCTGAGAVTVRGWLGRTPVLTRTPAAAPGRTTAVGLVLTDPFRAQRRRTAVIDEQYRTIFTLGVEAAP